MINKIRIGCYAIFIAYLVYSTYFFLTNPVNPTYKDCGEVISKSSDEVAIKHGTQTELYLNVQFRKSGFRSMEVEPTTYFRNNVGEVVCFNLYEEKPWWYNIFILGGMITVGVSCFAIAVGLIAFLIEPFFNEKD